MSMDERMRERDMNTQRLEPLWVLRRLLFAVVLCFGMMFGLSGAQAAGIISGTVFNDVNNNTTFNTGIDYGVSGVVVALQNSGGTEITTVTTGAGGTFTFPSQPAGSYRIQVKTAPTGYAAQSATATTVMASGSADTPNSHLGLRGTGGSIAGFVFNDVNRNLTNDDGASANIVGVRVQLKQGSTVLSTATTTSSGYTFRNLPSGVAFTVEVVESDLMATMLVGHTDSTVNSPRKVFSVASVTSALTGKSFATTEQVSGLAGLGIDGIVAIEIDGIVGYTPGADLLLAGAKVELFYNDGTTPVPGVAAVTTGADGKYEFFNLPMWRYRIKMTPPANFTASGNVSPVSNDVIGIELTSVNPVGAQNFYATGVNGVTGAVFGYASGGFSSNFGPDGGGTQNQAPGTYTTAFSNVTVQLYQGSTLLLTQKTKADGTYSFKGIPTGTYTVRISESEMNTLRPDYGFMNDTDGKSSYKSKAPFEVSGLSITSMAASALRSNQNFWFGRVGSTRTAFSGHVPIFEGRNTWNLAENGVTMNGYTPKGTYKLYEQDGQTPAKDKNGNEFATVIQPTTQIGGGRGYVVFGEFIGGGGGTTADVIPNVYVVKPVAGTVDSSLTIEPNVTGLTTGWRITSSNNLLNGVVQGAYKGTNKVSGKIYVDDGTPLHLARLELITLNSSGSAVDSTYRTFVFGADENGEYRFENLPNGYYRIRVTVLPAEYASQITGKTDYDGGTDSSFVVHLTGNANITTGDIVYQPNNTSFYITGTVWQDMVALGTLEVADNSAVTGVGTKGYYDLELDGITLTLRDNSTNATQTYTTTQTGKFNFTGLSGNRSYTLTASGSSVTFINFGEGTNTRTITFGATSGLMKNQNILVQGYGKVTISAFVDVNGDGLRNTGDYYHSQFYYRLYKKIGGTYVDLRPSQIWDAQSIMDFSSFPPGEYRFVSTRAQDISIADSAPDGSNPDGSIGSFDFTIPTGTTPTVFDNARIIYGQGSWDVSGSVYADINGNGILDSEDRIITTLSGIGIKIFETPRFLNDFTTAGQRTYNAANPEYTGTVASGNYTIGGIRSGNLLINIDEANLATQGYAVINNAPNAVPHGTNATLPTALRTKSTIQMGFQTGNQTNQNFLVNRTITVEVSGKVYQDVMYNNIFDSGEDVGITGQTIQLYQGTSATGTPYASVVVDANGDYSFNNLPNGTYTVRLVPGNIPASLELVEAAASASYTRTFTVNASNPSNLFTQNFWFNKLGEAGIAGSVLIDLDGSGTPDVTKDSPLSGITVTATPNGGGATVTTTTNARGLYKITGLEIGKTYVVTVSGLPSNYNVFKTAGTTPTNTATIATAIIYPDRYFLVAGNSNPNPGVNPKNGGISGHLYVGANATPASPRLPNVTVEISDSSGIISGSVETDSNGFYGFYNISVGPNYTIKVTGATPGYAVRGDVDGAPLGQITTGVTAGTTKANQNIWYAAISTVGITGKVVYSPTYSTTASATDVPLSGMTVELYDAANVAGGVLYSTTTNSTGDYSFPGIATMSYVLKVKDADKTAKGYVDLTPATGQMTINLPAAGSTGNLFILGGQHELSGLIWQDSNGDGDPDIGIGNIPTTLTWAGPDNNLTTTADNIVFSSVSPLPAGAIAVSSGRTTLSGAYSYPHLPSGNYRVAYDATDAAFTGLALMADNGTTVVGNTAQPRSVAIATTDLTDVNFAYQSLAKIEGKLTFNILGDGTYAASDPGLKGISLKLQRDSGSGYVDVPGQTTTTSSAAGTEGEFSFTGIGYGQYRVVIDTSSPQKMANYKMVYNQKGAVTVAKQIDGTVDATAASQAGWIVGFYGNGDKTRIMTRTDDGTTANAYDAGDSAFGAIPIRISDAIVTIPIVTNSSGNYEIGLPYGTYSFVADNSAAIIGTHISIVYNSAGTTSNTMSNVSITANPANQYYGFKGLPNQGSLGISGRTQLGTAYAAANPGINGVPLKLYIKAPTGYYAYHSTVTSATISSVLGSYGFSNLASGDYQVVATVPGGHAVSYGFDNATDPIKSGSVTSNTTWNLGFIITSGRVVTFETRFDNGMPTPLNNQYDAADGPASGVVVNISGNGVNIDVTTNTSGQATQMLADGTYTITSKAPTNYNVVYSTAGNNNTATSFTFVVDNDATKVARFGYVINDSTPTNPLNLSGRVVFAAGSTYQASDLGIGGARVFLEKKTAAGDFGPVGIATTPAIGSYSFTVDRNSEYQTSVLNPPTSAAKVFPSGTHNTGVVAAAISNWHFGYQGSGSTYGKLQVNTYNDDGDMVGSLEPSGTIDSALGSVAIKIEGITGAFETNFVTNASGLFEFPAVPAGQYRLTVTTIPTGTTIVYNSESTTGAAITPTVAGGATTNSYYGFAPNVPSGALKISGLTVLDTGMTVGSVDGFDIRRNGVELQLYYETATGSNVYLAVPGQKVISGSGAWGAGYYEFTGLGASASRRYQVKVVGGEPASSTLVFPASGSYEFTLSADSANRDFGFNGTGTGYKTGTIETKAASGTTYSATDPAQPNVAIQITGTNPLNVFLPMSSGASGSITLTNFPVDTYTVVATTPTNHELVFNTLTNVSPNPTLTRAVTTSTTTVLDYYGYRVKTGNFKVTGRVVYDSNNDNVYTASDIGIVGATLKLYMVDGILGDLEVTDSPQLTDGAGSYTFEHLAAGDYKLVVQTMGPITATLDNVVPSSNTVTFSIIGDENDRHFVYKSQNPATVTIRTRFDDSAPLTSYDSGDSVQGNVPFTIVNAAVGINYADSTHSGTGDFVIHNIPRATYQIGVTTPAGMKVVYNPNGTGTGNPVGFAATAATNNAPYGFQTNLPSGPNTLAGRVVIDTNNNGSYDASDWGIKDIEVLLAYEADPSGNPGVFYPISYSPVNKTVDTAGNYSFMNLPNGRYQVSVVESTLPTGLAIRFVNDPSVAATTSVLTGTLNGSATNWHFGYHRDPGTPDAGTLTVMTHHDANGNHGYDSGTDPEWGNFDVQVTSADGKISNTITTATGANEGRFDIHNLPYLTYQLQAVNIPTVIVFSYYNDGADSTTNGNTLVMSTPTKTVRYGFEPDWRGTLSLGGRVVLDSNNNGYDATDSGLASTLTIEMKVGSSYYTLPITETATVVGNGVYDFTSALKGGNTYRVTATTPGYGISFVRSGAPDSAVVAEIEAILSASESNWHFGYKGDAGFDGYVKFDADLNGVSDSYDVGIAGVTVIATQGAMTVTTTTDATGYYKFENIGSGNWTVTVDDGMSSPLNGYTWSFAGSGNTSSPWEITVMATSTTPPNNGQRDFGFKGQGTIKGKVVLDLNGNGILDPEDVTAYTQVRARLSSNAGDAGFANEDILVDSAGEFEFTDLTIGFGSTLGYDYKVDFYYVSGPLSANVLTFIHDADTGAAPAAGYIGNVATSSFNQVLASSQPVKNRYTIGFGTQSKVSGKVTFDVDASNSLTTPDVPLSAIGVAGTVTLHYTGSLLPAPTDVTVAVQPDGSYEVTGLMEGDWLVTPNIIAPPFTLTNSYANTNVGAGSYAITINATNTQPVVNFGYYGVEEITGFVKLDRDVDTLDSAMDTGIPGVQVVLRDPANTFTRTATTDSTGKYSFLNLTPWTASGTTDYEVTVDYAQSALGSYDYQTNTGASNPINQVGATKQYRQAFDLTVGTTPHSASTYLAKGNRTLSGKVYHDVNDNGTFDAGDLPFSPSVTVTLKGEDPLAPGTYIVYQTTTTNGVGDYSFSGLIPEAGMIVEVTGVPAAYTPSFDYDDAHSIASTPSSANEATVSTQGGSLNSVDFGYIYGGIIETVIYEGDITTIPPTYGTTPVIPGAKVELQTNSGTVIQTAIAGANGSVTFRNLDITATYRVVTYYGLDYAPEVLAQTLYVDARDFGGALSAGTTVPSPLGGGVATLVVPMTAAPGGQYAGSTDAIYFVFQTKNEPVVITKVARRDSARVGEFVPYVITITNEGDEKVEDVSLKDLIPAGFKYVKGSGRYTGPDGVTVQVADPTDARPIVFEKLITLDPGEKAQLTYIMVVGAGVTQGEYVNRAHAVNQFGFQNSNIASAKVRVVGDPLFDDSLIFGKVFLDVNRNGRQDKDEPGVGGVKLVTARGEIITTDEHGRYHLADVSGGRWERGTNFILKLDTRSLPQGLITTTENPIVVRLSPGLPSRINFGVEVPPPLAEKLMENQVQQKKEEVKQIEEKLQVEERFVVESVHFAFDRDQILPEFESTLDNVTTVLKNHPEWRIRIEGHTDAIGSATYNEELSQRRANAVRAYLLNSGVNPNQLVDAVGYGFNEPIADNGNADGRFRNRRVEFKLVR